MPADAQAFEAPETIRRMLVTTAVRSAGLLLNHEVCASLYRNVVPATEILSAVIDEGAVNPVDAANATLTVEAGAT